MTVDWDKQIDSKLKQNQIILPPVPVPAGSYQPVVVAGHFAFLSGQLSRKADGQLVTGKAGADLTLAAAQEAARLAALNVVSVFRQFVGFDRFKRVIRLVGYVQAAPDFFQISQVMNGASDFMIELFGESGSHARSAVGMVSLPLNAAVEIEATIELRESK